MHGNFTVIFPIIMNNRSVIHTMTVDASNLYCKIALVWLDSSLSVVDIYHPPYKRLPHFSYQPLSESP